MEAFAGTQAVNWSNITIDSFQSQHALLDRWNSYQTAPLETEASAPKLNVDGFGWRKSLTLTEA